MAITYLHTCDGCGQKVEVEHGPFGANAIPDGWVRADVWPGGGQQMTCCSWACLGKAATKKGKEANDA